MDIAAQQKKAADKFSEIGMPSVKEESWRFTDVSHIQFDDFHNKWTDSKLPYEPLSDLFIVFENGRISNEKSSFGSLPNGIKIHSIHDSQDERIGSLADSESGFVLYNTAKLELVSCLLFFSSKIKFDTILPSSLSEKDFLIEINSPSSFSVQTSLLILDLFFSITELAALTIFLVDL